MRTLRHELMHGLMHDAITKMPPLAFRFGVTFFIGGGKRNPIDFRFQKVSGLSASVSIEQQRQGGQNLYTQKLPTGVSYETLTLTRGMVTASPLNIELNVALSLFKFAPSNVLVTLFDENLVPLSAWFFFAAYPIKWSTTDLDATSKELMIDTIELAYTRMQIMRL